VREAARAGASFVLVSPVFAVPGKNPPLGLDGLRRLADGCAVPLVALGGIDARAAAAVRRHGAGAIAVIREVFDAADPGAAVRALLAAPATI
jgi:thiamine-phosphate pyrophosphorylase